MGTDVKKIKIDDVEYVRADSVSAPAIPLDGMPYVIVRAPSGVFAGYLKGRNDHEVAIVNYRRLYYWKGAMTLEQIAEEGVKCPSECKFTQVAGELEVLDAVAVYQVTYAAQKCIQGVKEWKS